MPTPVWPASLPQVLEIEGYSETLANTVIRTAMETGPAKRRRRFTAAPRPIKGKVTLDATQRATLKTFYETTLGGGALSFDWTDPVTGSPATFAFFSPPQIRGDDGLFPVTLDLELLP